MSLSGLFLILFLLVHLLGNLQLLKFDEGVAFNQYTLFMTGNPVIKIISYTLYTLILVHSIQGILIYIKNRKAKGQSYDKNATMGTNKVSRYMAHLGILIFIFLLIHLYQFWWKMKMGQLPTVHYEGYSMPVMDLYSIVQIAYTDLTYVIFYVVSMIFVGLHLYHGFQSAFQTLGIHHKKYTPIIEFIGIAYSVFISIGFAIIPIIMYFYH